MNHHIRGHFLQIKLQGANSAPAATPSDPVDIFCGRVKECSTRASKYSWCRTMFSLLEGNTQPRHNCIPLLTKDRHRGTIESLLRRQSTKEALSNQDYAGVIHTTMLPARKSRRFWVSDFHKKSWCIKTNIRGENQIFSQ